MINYFLKALKEAVKQWLLGLIATIGIVSGIVQLFPKLGEFSYVALCLIVFPIASTIIYLIKFKKYDYLSENIVPHDTDDKVEIKVHFPCNQIMFQGANSLANEAFGKAGLSPRVIEGWRTSNPYILSCLTDKGKFVGYFDVLPLNPAFGESFFTGDVGEKSIRGEHILSFKEMKDCEYIYFSGIAVRECGTRRGLRRGSVMLRAALEYMEVFYDFSAPKKIYTIPISDSGKRIVDSLGFKLEQDGFLRKDKLDFFSKEVDYEVIQELKESLGRLERYYDFSCYNEFKRDLSKKQAKKRLS